MPSELPSKFRSTFRIALFVTAAMICPALIAGCSQVKRASRDPEGPDHRAHPIRAVLRDQSDAWNAGDVERFMEYYWKSDRLTFSSGGIVTRGWAETLANYRRRYPTPERMGTVRFDAIEVFPLGADAAMVLGEWHLEREPDALHGNFTLVFRKIDGRWLIIHDHTSRADS